MRTPGGRPRGALPAHTWGSGCSLQTGDGVCGSSRRLTAAPGHSGPRRWPGPGPRPRPRAGARLTLTLTHTSTYTQQRADAGQCPAGRAGSAEAALESAYLAGSLPGPVTWAVRRSPGGGSQSGQAWPDFCRQLWPPGPPHGRGQHHRGYFHGSPGPGNREGAGPRQLVL